MFAKALQKIDLAMMLICSLGSCDWHGDGQMGHYVTLD